MADFGWSYPAGCSSVPGDEEYEERIKGMTTYEFDGNKYIVRFCYPDTEHHRNTQCEIYKVESDNSDTLLGLGRVSCYVKDQYSKVIGRKLAFTKALENAGFDKDLRTKLWYWYKTHLRFQ